MLRSVNPYLCPILGVRAHRAEARIGVHMIIVSLGFDERGAAFSILNFFVLQVKLMILY
jgi:hypothetical protein